MSTKAFLSHSFEVISPNCKHVDGVVLKVNHIYHPSSPYNGTNIQSLTDLLQKHTSHFAFKPF